MPASYAPLFSTELAAAASEGDVAIDGLLEAMFAISASGWASGNGKPRAIS